MRDASPAVSGYTVYLDLPAHEIECNHDHSDAPGTTICDGLATLLHLARDVGAGGGKQGPTAVVRQILGVSGRRSAPG